MIVAFAALCFLCALVPAVMFVTNLTLYVPPPSSADAVRPVSILIPARNEAGGIADAVNAALASAGVEFEVVVMDDGSTDGTVEIVQQIAAVDPRLRLELAPALPNGWNGKQHACWALANAARNPLLCFVDADVRLAPECVARMAAFLGASESALVSGFPRQVTETPFEWILLPLIHFVLLGFLPIELMRTRNDPSFAAGCGQFFMARRTAYFECGGHSGIKLTMHDGLRLPKLFREAGFKTDLADITDFASCRMYASAEQVWNGLAKNATEGIADPKRIVPISLVLFLGQVVPFLQLLGVVYTMAIAWLFSSMLGSSSSSGIDATYIVWLALNLLAAVCAWLPRFLGVKRFRQNWLSALFHPLGIVVLLSIQWYALFRKLSGGKISWRDRAYSGIEA